MFYLDVQKLKGKMAEKGYNITSLSQKLGISRNTLANYMRNPGKFPYETLEEISLLLFDTPEEVSAILFAQKLA